MPLAPTNKSHRWCVNVQFERYKVLRSSDVQHHIHGGQVRLLVVLGHRRVEKVVHRANLRRHAAPEISRLKEGVLEAVILVERYLTLHSHIKVIVQVM
jgi:hypothetical protein